MDRELYKLSIFLKNLITREVKDVRDTINAYQQERWMNNTPSKREYLAAKKSLS